MTSSLCTCYPLCHYISCAPTSNNCTLYWIITNTSTTDSTWPSCTATRGGGWHNHKQRAQKNFDKLDVLVLRYAWWQTGKRYWRCSSNWWLWPTLTNPMLTLPVTHCKRHFSLFADRLHLLALVLHSSFLAKCLISLPILVCHRATTIIQNLHNNSTWASPPITASTGHVSSYMLFDWSFCVRSRWCCIWSLLLQGLLLAIIEHRNQCYIFAYFSQTPISISKLTVSMESHWTDVSNCILSVQKYCQLSMHESNTFLLKICH